MPLPLLWRCELGDYVGVPVSHHRRVKIPHRNPNTPNLQSEGLKRPASVSGHQTLPSCSSAGVNESLVGPLSANCFQTEKRIIKLLRTAMNDGRLFQFGVGFSSTFIGLFWPCSCLVTLLGVHSSIHDRCHIPGLKCSNGLRVVDAPEQFANPGKARTSRKGQRRGHPELVFRQSLRHSPRPRQ